MTRAPDAAGVAKGSGIVLAASMVDQAARLVVTWTIARTLGAAAFGVWSYAFTVATLVGTIAPLGLQVGVVLFVARYYGTGENDRVKGTVITSLALAAGSGLAFSVALCAAATLRPGWFGSPEVASVLALGAPAVALQAFVLVQIGLLRAARDIRGFATVYQVVFPCALLVGGLLAVGLDAGVRGIVVALVVALAAANLAALPRIAKRFGPLLRDSGVPATIRPRELLSFSLPQSVAVVVTKLTLWLDVLILGHLATLEDVGLYRAAVSIALTGQVLVYAVQSSANPVVADLVHRGEHERLDALVETVTRWIVMLAAPAFMAVALLRDVILGLIAPEYVASSGVLLVLLVGQALSVATGALAPLVPMSGRSRLEMTNGIAAVVVAVCLHLTLIPRLGAMGAAIASSTAFGTAALLRFGAVWYLLGCQPFRARTLGLIGAALLLALAAADLGAGHGVVLRVLLTTSALAAFAGLAWWIGFSAQDRELADKFRARVRRLAG